MQCFETRVNRLIGDPPRVSTIYTLRNRPNDKGITFQFGKRKGQLKPFKHKDCM